MGACCSNRHPYAGQRRRLNLHQRRPVQLHNDPLPKSGSDRLDRVLPRSGCGTDCHWAAPAHKIFDVAAFVEAARRPVDVIQPDPDACHQPVQASQRLAQPIRSALLPELAFKVVGAKVKLHDRALEKLRQLEFVADANSEKAISL